LSTGYFYLVAGIVQPLASWFASVTAQLELLASLVVSYSR